MADTGERRLGCGIADAVETGVRTTVMPGRQITETPGTAPECAGDCRTRRADLVARRHAVYGGVPRRRFEDGGTDGYWPGADDVEERLS